ncbi:type II secretion system protein [Fibrobacter sp.]|uniref:type II secretion system protein n=1 Tax=Fibrobacter sp. TaxID=35828 RepID=UPI00388F5055
MKGKFHMKRGFTMIEIMVVIVILGVLAGVGAPKIMGVIEKTKEKADLMKLYYLRDALNKALLENEEALTNTTTAKKLSDDERQKLITKMYDGFKYVRGASLFVIEVHNGLSVNVQDSHNEANNTYNVSAILGTSGTWCDALREAGFEGVADIVADRITNNYKKETSTYTSFQWHDDKKNKDWQRTAPKKPMFISLALNKGKKDENTRFTMNARWTDIKDPGHSLEVYILPNGKNWNAAFRTDNGTCFSTYGDIGCQYSD